MEAKNRFLRLMITIAKRISSAIAYPAFLETSKNLLNKSAIE
jgi:hypothetical protein